LQSHWAADSLTGFAHLGVLEVLEQAQIPVYRSWVPVSGLLGAAYADGISLRELCDLGRRVSCARLSSGFINQIRADRGGKKHGKDCIGSLYRNGSAPHDWKSCPFLLRLSPTDLDTGAAYVFNEGADRSSHSRKPAPFRGWSNPWNTKAACLPMAASRRLCPQRSPPKFLADACWSQRSFECGEFPLQGRSGEGLRSRLPRFAQERAGAVVVPHADVLLEPLVHHIGWNDFSRVTRLSPQEPKAMRRALPSLRELLARRSQSPPPPDSSFIAKRGLAL